jgi:hypothetical protein
VRFRNLNRLRSLKVPIAALISTYILTVVLGLSITTAYSPAKADSAMERAVNVLLFSPVAIGRHAGESIYAWMFGEPKSVIPGGGYGETCPFLSDFKTPSFDCRNIQPTTPPWSTSNQPLPGQPGFTGGFPNPQDPCSFYRHLLACQKGCSEMEKNRLIGYFQTCSGMTQLISPIATPPIYNLGGDGGNLIAACSSNQNFQNYVHNMRSCLQVAVTTQLGSCKNCSSLVTNIIEAHTPCNANTGFCTSLGNDPQALRCLGAALGASWQGLSGGHSLSGPVRSVGICHLLEQSITCAARGQNFTNWWNNICGGYQLGCRLAGGRICGWACPMADQLSPELQNIIAQITQIGAEAGSYYPGMVGLLEGTCQELIFGDGPNF